MFNTKAPSSYYGAYSGAIGQLIDLLNRAALLQPKTVGVHAAVPHDFNALADALTGLISHVEQQPNANTFIPFTPTVEGQPLDTVVAQLKSRVESLRVDHQAIRTSLDKLTERVNEVTVLLTNWEGSTASKEYKAIKRLAEFLSEQKHATIEKKEEVRHVCGMNGFGVGRDGVYDTCPACHNSALRAKARQHP